MTVNKTKIFANNSCGTSVLEVILAMAIVGLATPFIYNQIVRMNREIQTVSMANKIISVRDDVLNFIRMNQDDWPDVAQIQLTDDELRKISPDAVSGFIDKYVATGGYVTDVYLSFDIGRTELEAYNVVRRIGDDAAVVGSDGIAVSTMWAAAAPDFVPGQIVYRLSRDLMGEDRSKYLHRSSGGTENLNQMQRDLNMGANGILDVGTIYADSGRVHNVSTTFVNVDDMYSDYVYFSSGANMNATNVMFDTLRVTGDISGFRNINTKILNGTTHTTSGRVVANRATINNLLDVANNFNLKASSVRTISGFTIISAGSVFVPYISTEEITFFDDFGLTVAAELLLSSSSPIKIGNWSLGGNSQLKFSELTLSRAPIPNIPDKRDFPALFDSAWKTITPPEQIIQ